MLYREPPTTPANLLDEDGDLRGTAACVTRTHYVLAPLQRPRHCRGALRRGYAPAIDEPLDDPGSTGRSKRQRLKLLPQRRVDQIRRAVRRVRNFETRGHR